ncbi:MAG: ABC transporter permease subunit [Kineosporiaceae bacterium]|nr:ABC transporter permease subunit [Aeromicrobium sp.]
MSWLIENFPYVWSLTLKHIWLSGIPIVLGFMLGLPIGWYASRHPRLRGTILSTGSVIYTIPSLPLLVLLPTFIGTKILSPINLVIALTFYAAAIMVRSASDAFLAVSPEVLDAATATGYSPVKLFLAVHLPLAGPVLLAGLRVVAVSTVSLVSIGALTGISSLGSLFTDGFQRGFTTEIVIGVILTVVVALVFDALLILGAKVLMPWASVARARSEA